VDRAAAGFSSRGDGDDSPAYPFGALAVFAIDVLVIYDLATH
jgi:hypothetical protein